MSESIATRIGELAEMRYPSLLIVIDDRTLLSPVGAAELAAEAGLRYVNYLLDVIDTGDGPVLGGYSWVQFREWLREQARDTGGLVVDQVDQLITTWPPPDRTHFFEEFLRTEFRTCGGRNAPVVLLSELAAHISLPEQKRTGQGLVIRVARPR